MERCLAALVVLCVLILNVPIPWHMEIPALEISTNPLQCGHVIPRTVRFDGVYRINLFTDHTFEGGIQISGYEAQTQQGQQWSVSLSQKEEFHLRQEVPNWRKDDPDHPWEWFGSLFASDFFREFIIIPFTRTDEGGHVEFGYSSYDMIGIVSRVESREQAVHRLDMQLFYRPMIDDYKAPPQ